MTDMHTDNSYVTLKSLITAQGICSSIIEHGSLHLEIDYKTFRIFEQGLFENTLFFTNRIEKTFIE